jgi:FAD:protein FMN transferase
MMHPFTRRECLKAGLLSLGVAAVDVAALGGPCPADGTEFSFHYDHILGTSLDVWVLAPDADTAGAAERAVLDEVERLRRVFSTFDPSSEISQVNRTRGPAPASDDLLAVLSEYEVWQRRSGGACSALLGSLMAIWAGAEISGAVPDDATLATVVCKTPRPGFVIDSVNRMVTRLTDQPFNLHSVAKGYVIQRAAAVVREAFPAIRGGLLNLGGDLLTWGQMANGPRGTLIGVQDPFQPEENGAPLTVLRLQDAAVASSGGYQRYYTVGGRRFSHLIDPRSGRPADDVAGATVIAPDCVTANILATTLCVLTPADGLRLTTATPGAECLIIQADGQQRRSPGFSALELPAAAAIVCAKDEPKKDSADSWPDDYQLTINLELPKPENRARRPYVAVWVEDADGKPVRTVTVWGDNRKWLTELSGWWKFAKDDKELVKSVTRATRGPGKYSVVWDGKDDSGKALPQGTYTLKVEVHREHGKHVFQSGKITCGAEAAKVTLEKNVEAEESVLEYGKKKE